MGMLDKIKSGLRTTANFTTGGTLDRRKAKRINVDSEQRQKDIIEELDCAKENTKNELDSYGSLKVHIFSTTVSDFADVFNKLLPLDNKPLKENFTPLEFSELTGSLVDFPKLAVSFKKVAVTTGGLAITGATAAAGAMGLATVFGTAATGTAIGTLTGAAATNATLAWLGGGALSAGGSGMAGGVVVLGGISLAPVLVLGMFLGVKNGERKINDALNNADKVNVLEEKIKTLVFELSQIRKACQLLGASIKTLNGILVIKTLELEQVAERLNNRPVLNKFLIDPIRTKVFGHQLYSINEQQIILDSANCAALLKQLMDLPIMNEEGAFLSNVLEKHTAFEEQTHLLCKNYPKEQVAETSEKQILSMAA
jgi:hypothetical protein